jgi:CheY-like chemotaxis protein
MSLFRRRKRGGHHVPETPEVYPTTTSRGAGPRLLVCDDNNTVTQMLDLMFAREGWTVAITESGEAALAALTRVGPDVVLLDQQMDGMTGIETARVLRRRGFERPILLFSAFLDEKSRADAQELGVKAVSKVDFDAVVRHVTAAHAESRTSRRIC